MLIKSLESRLMADVPLGFVRGVILRFAQHYLGNLWVERSTHIR